MKMHKTKGFSLSTKKEPSYVSSKIIKEFNVKFYNQTILNNSTCTHLLKAKV
jgi:hypothetical protein